MDTLVNKATLSRFFHMNEEQLQNEESFLKVIQSFKFDCLPIQMDQVLYVDDLDGFDQNILLSNSILGVDIEQSNDVGFDGRICLIQFKAGIRDIIIDPIKIRDSEKLVVLLKQVFENPTIKKIFYAGNQDQLWLQRDYQIQINNYCDIREIAEIINKSIISFSFRETDNSLVALWGQYCNLFFPKEEKKQFQQSNWLDRPLTQKQLEYAALDSHYLPYLWQILVSEAFENLTQSDIVKLELKLQKQKKYEREGLTRYFFLRSIQNSLDETLNDFSYHYEDESYNLIKVNEKTIIKFIFSELCLACQEYGMQKDISFSQLDDEKTLQKAAVILFKLLTIEGLDKIKSFQEELKQYKNQQYEDRKKLFNQNSDISYLEFKNYRVNGFMNALQSDESFIKWALTEIHFSETYKQLQQDKDKRRLDEKHQRKLQYNTTIKDCDCQILAPDNMILCNCAEKKGRWYLKNDKATLVSESPMVIRLNFMPSGFQVTRMEGDEEITETQYITTERISQCVVCGCKSELLKYNIIPPSYKCHFPHIFKVSKTHGFVMLCIKCHDKAHKFQEELKGLLAKEYQVPIVQYSEQLYIQKRIFSLQKQTLFYKSKFSTYPKDVKQKFKMQIRINLKEIFDQKMIKVQYQLSQKLARNDKNNDLRINQDLFSLIENLDVQLISYFKKTIEMEKYDTKNFHGQLVVEKLQKDQDFVIFIERWRQNFLENMKPKFLPDAWVFDGKPISNQQLFYGQ